MSLVRPPVIAALVGAALIGSSSVQAEPKITLQQEAARSVTLEVGQTRLMKVSQEIGRISVANPDVADVRVVTPLQVLVTAKGVGYTDLILWSKGDKPLVIALSCVRNLNALRKQLKELFPKEDIRVSSNGDLVVLSGQVSDLRTPARVAEVAQLHSKQLANLLQVTGNQQVQLDVRFVEISRSGMREMGVNMLWQDGARGHVAGMFGAGARAGEFLANPPIVQVPGTGAGAAPLVATPVAGNAFNLLFSTATGKFPFSAIVSILAQKGLAKVLAEPTLVALSGQEADFHAGGELPIVVAQQLGTFSIRYKKFGIRLKFKPTVLGKRTINLKLYSEVSEPDPTTGVVLTGFNVPGIKTRNSETMIRLNDGQSFAVAGLLSDSTRSAVKKIPGLGDLPLLGALFRSTAFQRDETELLMVVKAHLVQPLKPDEVPKLPGEDDLNDPNDFQLFLMGQLSGGKKDTRRSNTTVTKTPGRPAGPVGFIR